MIKSKPEDFVVEEKANLPIRKGGNYKVYILKKIGWNTLDLIHRMAVDNSIQFNKFAYGGKKDKYGITQQYITVNDPKKLSHKDKYFSLQYIGDMDRPMGPDLISGNLFNVIIRDIKNADLVEKNVYEVKQFGFPNFYDNQRFRSFDPNCGFFAEKILKKQWNGAVKCFIASSYPDLQGKEKERRRELFNNWKKWEVCLSLSKSILEKKIFNILINKKDDFIKALHLISDEEISMQYSAYQAHLWNEVLRKILNESENKLNKNRGVEGDYYFWNRNDINNYEYIKSIEIPTVAQKIIFPDENIKKLYDEVLLEKGINYSSFNIKKLRNAYFKSFARKAIVIPEDLVLNEIAPDEINNKKIKFSLRYFLPRGSYGTMLIKRLFN